MDLTVRTQHFGGSDHSWLGSAHALDTCDPIELDLSLFTMSDYADETYIPAGVALAMVTATKKWGPYDNGNSPAGIGTGKGFLAFDVHVSVDGVAQTSGARPAALLWHGEVIEAKLPEGHGVDSSFKTDVPLIRFQTEGVVS